MCSYAAEQEYSIQDTKLAGGSIVFSVLVLFQLSQRTTKSKIDEL